MIAISLIILAPLIYSVCRVIINKKYNLNIPILPERYYDNIPLTIIQAILSIFSIAIAVALLELIQ
ncbi:hypothetical protein KQI88_15390 [Alkaliphilus sp. MSJ-5]|uniref:Uncharacterized protein n=1 Tax=Alkaliphilus flagellatus TaxID=2841507 RepID=A0ABS6G6M0_9FIRM|nr:hypothetical protein [Alkaliphilus flagellatus]MBU5677801.1 hypothetical protein [Alkaliphilus flagellatus]